MFGMIMAGTTPEEIEEAKDLISDAETISLADIPFALFESRSNRTTKLIVNSGDTATMSGSNRWHEFKFRQVVFVYRVTVVIGGYNDSDEFGIRWTDEEGETHRAETSVEDGNVIFEVNDLCRAIAFRPPTKFFTVTTIDQVQIEGVQRANFKAMISTIANIETRKNEVLAAIDAEVEKLDQRISEVETIEEKRDELQEEIETLDVLKEALKVEISEVTARKNQLIAENGVAENAIEQAKARSADLRQAFDVSLNKNTELTAEVQRQEGILKNLRDNINLFPSELVDFVNQGARSIELYFVLAAIPIAVIGMMFWHLTSGAINLTTVFTGDENVNIPAILLTRLPYVAVALGIITACYKIARVFILETMRINRQRLSLTKISIIAKDISSASEVGLDLPDDELFRLRSELKMALLRDHLKKYISDDFVLSLPKKVMGVIPIVDPILDQEVDGDDEGDEPNDDDDGRDK